MIVEWTQSEDETGRSQDNEHARIGYVRLSVGPVLWRSESEWWWTAGAWGCDDSGTAPTAAEAKDAAIMVACGRLVEMRMATDAAIDGAREAMSTDPGLRAAMDARRAVLEGRA